MQILDFTVRSLTMWHRLCLIVIFIENISSLDMQTTFINYLECYKTFASPYHTRLSVCWQFGWATNRTWRYFRAFLISSFFQLKISSRNSLFYTKNCFYFYVSWWIVNHLTWNMHDFEYSRCYDKYRPLYYWTILFSFFETFNDYFLLKGRY